MCHGFSCNPQRKTQQSSPINTTSNATKFCFYNSSQNLTEFHNLQGPGASLQANYLTTVHGALTAAFNL